MKEILALFSLCFFAASAQAEPSIEYLTTQKLSHISTDVALKDKDYRQYVWAKSDAKYSTDGSVELVFDARTQTLLSATVKLIDLFSTKVSRIVDSDWIFMTRYPVFSDTTGTPKTTVDQEGSVYISTQALNRYHPESGQFSASVTLKNINKKMSSKLYNSILAAKWMQLELKTKDYDTSDRLLTQKGKNEVSLVLVFPQSDELGREIKNSTFYTYLMDWTWLE